MLKKWSDFRRRQREILRASNTPTAPDGDAGTDEQPEPDLLTAALPLDAIAATVGAAAVTQVTATVAQVTAAEALGLSAVVQGRAADGRCTAASP